MDQAAEPVPAQNAHTGPVSGRTGRTAPKFLPDVHRELRWRRIEALGVRITCGHRVTDLATQQATGGFDAVFVAVGAHGSRPAARAACRGHRRERGEQPMNLASRYLGLDLRNPLVASAGR